MIGRALERYLVEELEGWLLDRPCGRLCITRFTSGSPANIMAPTVTVEVLRVSKEDGDVSPPIQLGSSKSEPNLSYTNEGTLEGENAADGIENDFGDRPDCFKSTFQEVSFVFQATMATATSSFLTGVCLIVTASIGRDLGMTQGQISWITASTRYELFI